MARKIKSAANQLFNFARDSYLERTSRPVYAIVYLLPLVIFYELGTLFINTDVLSQAQVRVAAFVWLQEFLRWLGFGGRFLWMAPALVVVIILLAYQYVSAKPWWVCFTDMLPMTLECVTLAIPLIVLSLFLHTPAVTQNFAVSAFSETSPLGGADTAANPAHSLLADIVTGVGAGIYEELLFRLILICTLLVLFQDVLGLGKNNSVVLAVLISAGLFGAHHHIDLVSGGQNQADLFDWAKFIFRTMAGVYFAILFAIRGFAITAGTHAFYDVIATLLNAMVFVR